MKVDDGVDIDRRLVMHNAEAVTVALVDRAGPSLKRPSVAGRWFIAASGQ